jgi:predicted Ser/Thr protein kinase
MKPLLHMGLLQKRIVELYNEFLESPQPSVDDVGFQYLKEAILETITLSKLSEKEWKKYGFRVVRGNSAAVLKGCFCKEGEPMLKDAVELGSGAFGTVHKSRIPDCIKGIPKGVEWIAIKMEKVGGMFISDSQLPENLRKHVTVIQEAARAGLTPMVYDVFICMDEKDQVTIVKVMEFVKGIRLMDWLPTASKANALKAKQILTEKVQQLGKLGILHNDLHGGNIMVVQGARGALNDVVIIDYDLATFAENAEVKRASNIFNQSRLFDMANTILHQLIKEKTIVV